MAETVAGPCLFEKARIYEHRLWEFAAELGSTSVMGPEKFHDVYETILPARHEMITAMPGELGLGGDEIKDFNPFVGTCLEGKDDQGERKLPGPLKL